MMRIVAVLLLTAMLAAGCAQSASLKAVKNVRNSAGVAAADIPKMIEKKMGFEIESAKWVEKAKDGFVKVCLLVKAKKEQREPVYVSYGWSPEWEWSIEESTGVVIPVNALAKQWMKGNI